MNTVDTYVHDVLSLIHTRPADRQRIESDLRAHLAAALESGESPQAVLDRMGTPAEIAGEFMAQVGVQYASYVRRAGACLIDMALLIGVGGLFSVLAVTFSNLVPRGAQGFEQVVAGLWIALTVICTISVVGLVLLYFPILEGRFGQTPGKRLLGLRVVRENGLPIDYKEAILRRLSFYFDFFAPDALFPLFTARRQRAMDIVAHTIVIDENPRQPTS